MGGGRSAKLTAGEACGRPQRERSPGVALVSREDEAVTTRFTVSPPAKSATGQIGLTAEVRADGGSSAGVYVNNRVMFASLFRGVPDEQFNARVKNIFLELQKAWNGIPFELVNDGEVTALAGAMSLKDDAVLGVALGSSQAAGFE